MRQRPIIVNVGGSFFVNEDAMSDPNKKMIFHVKTVRIDGHGSLAKCKSADITLDTDLTARGYLRVLGDKHVCIPCSGYER